MLQNLKGTEEHSVKNEFPSLFPRHPVSLFRRFVTSSFVYFFQRSSMHVQTYFLFSMIFYTLLFSPESILQKLS